MGFWIPAILLGSVGASHHYASKELDYITKEADQPTFGFWWGVSLGVLGGVWIGFSYHQGIRRGLKCLEWFAGVDESASNKQNTAFHHSPSQLCTSDMHPSNHTGYIPVPPKPNLAAP